MTFVDRTRDVLAALVVGASAALVVAGCVVSPRPLGGQCEVNSDCDAPLVCRLDRCRRECATTRDCPAGTLCVSGARGLGACLLPDEVSCRDDADCPEALVCRADRCTEPCDDADLCAPGARCAREGEGDGFCEDPAGLPCRLDSDCEVAGAELVCGPDLRCRAACRADRDCREGTRCEAERCVPVARDDGGTPFDGSPRDAAAPDGGADDAGADDAGTDAGGAPPVPCASDAECVAAGLALAACDPVSGTCRILRCADGLADCDGDFRTGCETTVSDDPANCGGCGVSCGRLATCSGGFCDSAVEVALGPRHVCVLRGSGQLLCAGANDRGQLARGATSPSEPTLEPATGFTWIPEAVFAGPGLTCARTRNGFGETRLECVGDNTDGQLGRTGAGGPTPMRATVVEVGSQAPHAYPAAFGGDVARAADGSPSGASTDGFGCGLRGAGRSLRCWGSATVQYPGVSVAPGAFFTVDFGTADATEGVTAVAAGVRHVCAIQRGAVHCFGVEGPWLGLAATGGSVVGPTAIPWSGDAVAVAAGAAHSCAARRDGTVACWGDNTHGQVGPGVAVGSASATPVDVPLTDVVALAAGDRHTCALDATRRVHCWGDNARGELGDGTTTPSATPVRAGSLADVVQLDLAFGRSCAVRSDGAVFCWGSTGADHGVMGDASAWTVPTPHPDFPGTP